MRLTKYVSLFVLLLSALVTSGQEVHNFKMHPEKTDCHQIQLTDNLSDNIELIEQSTFRFMQTIKISRYHAPNNVAYYSCDGEKGYLIAQETDSSFLYQEVRKTLYDSLISSDDPIQFYADHIKTKLKSQHE
ncbi:hypothetical protein [Fulvivirga lutimaris]|uniref:hypothetical protein n=1 Tax=Fulvivirga lutimaris TaxID=1819566 RepID=UPI0012BC909A|nr:hypothetical protein [Fulvivirga lutimaris]MTI39593.1 hypothetical protein [Fulvivirga lutimaris]